MAVGRLVVVGAALADLAVGPAAAEAGRLDRRGQPLEIAGRRHAVGGVAETGVVGLGDDEAVVIRVLVGPQVRGPAAALRDLHAEQIREEAHGLLGLGAEQLGVGQLRDRESGSHGLFLRRGVGEWGQRASARERRTGGSDMRDRPRPAPIAA